MRRWTALLVLGLLLVGVHVKSAGTSPPTAGVEGEAPSGCARGGGDASPYNDPEARAQRIGRQLRCPVCRGVPIFDSPSTLAREMVDIVRQQVAAGKTDQEILKYFEERYGEWVLLAPKTEGMNLLVWLLPALFLAGGGTGIVLRLRQRKQKK